MIEDKLPRLQGYSLGHELGKYEFECFLFWMFNTHTVINQVIFLKDSFID